MQPSYLILGGFATLLVLALTLRLLDHNLWKQDPWQLGLKIALGLLIIALTLGLLYVFAPSYPVE